MKRSESIGFYSRSPRDTERFARQLSAVVVPGDVILLHGELGAGKTLFAAELCVSFGVPREHIASPTYTVLRRYIAHNFTIYHWDFYRISSLDELEMADFFELTAENTAITIVEWASLFPEAWQDVVPRCEVFITGGDEYEHRQFRLEWNLAP